MIANPVPWPNGAKCAVAITFDMDAESLIHLEHPKDGHNRVSALSMLRYGPEVAVPRILETYRRYEIKQTFFIPAWCIEQYPRTVEAIVEAGHEVGHHGYIHENPQAASRDEEQYWLRRSIDVIERATGQRPRGWRAPLYNFSQHSADLLLEEGFVYDASLMGDDVPYVLTTPNGELIELPLALGDGRLAAVRAVDGPRLHDADQVGLGRHGRVPRRVRRDVGERRPVGRRLASLRHRAAGALAPGGETHRLHARAR